MRCNEPSIHDLHAEFKAMSLAFVGKKEEVAAAPAGKVRVTRRSLLAGAAGLIGLSAAGTVGYAAAIEPQQLVVTPDTLKPRGWPAGRKLTITVIADLHAGGPDMPLPNVQRIVDTANALKSDVIVMLGDYIARYRFAVERIPDPVWAAELARLQAPLGVWAILGNHDWWYDLAGVRNALAEVRIPLLENQAVLLGPEGERVCSLEISRSWSREVTAHTDSRHRQSGGVGNARSRHPRCCWSPTIGLRAHGSASCKPRGRVPFRHSCS